jgi:DNA mismatch endonuclease (patch repair protein)
MLANVGHPTTPEVNLRKALFRRGLRFRKYLRPEASFRCVADIVFPKKRVCVFVDGCFWHGCRTHFRVPRANAEWWAEKIDENRERDKKQTSYLRAAGWRVVRVWEHEQMETVAAAIDHLLTRTR